METWRLTLEYAGTRYRGWQEQPGLRTVAGEVRGAARETLGVQAELLGAGRTDAGVHALAQVARLTAKRKPRGSGNLADALNALLPHDIHVLRAEPAPRTFDPRRDPAGRSYLYQISRRRSAFLKPFVWWVPDRLDAARMREAAALFCGLRDFTAFSEPDAGRTSTRVHVSHASWTAHGDLMLFRIVASHFLWKMVRRLVGASVRVGTGAMEAAAVERMLATGQGTAAEWTAPPSGLFLEKVLFSGDELGPVAPAIAGR